MRTTFVSIQGIRVNVAELTEYYTSSASQTLFLFFKNGKVEEIRIHDSKIMQKVMDGLDAITLPIKLN